MNIASDRHENFSKNVLVFCDRGHTPESRIRVKTTGYVNLHQIRTCPRVETRRSRTRRSGVVYVRHAHARKSPDVWYEARAISKSNVLVNSPSRCAKRQAKFIIRIMRKSTVIAEVQTETARLTYASLKICSTCYTCCR